MVKPMNIRKSIDKLKENEGLYAFVVRSCVFFGTLFGIYLLIFLWARHLDFFVQYLRIDDGFYLPFLTGLRKSDFLNAGVFGLIGFFLWNRQALTKTIFTKRFPIETALFSALAVISFISHYLFKYWVATNTQTAAQMVSFVVWTKFLLLVFFILFLGLAVYTYDFVIQFIKKYWKSLLIFFAVGLVYFFLIQFFQLIWYELSYFVTIVLKSLLGLTFDDVYFSEGSTTFGPKLGANGFNVGISNECSGIDSLLLFISLYTLLLTLDWKRMHVKRMLMLLIPGLIGTVAYNILRIYLLMLVGIYIDPRFAIDVFHTNIGWMLFLVFFIVFWNYGSKWVYIKKEDKGSKAKKKKSKGKKKASKKSKNNKPKKDSPKKKKTNKKKITYKF